MDKNNFQDERDFSNWYTQGEMYRNGVQVKKNLAKARGCYEKIINEAQAELDDYYFLALFQWSRVIAEDQEHKEEDLNIALHYMGKVRHEYAYNEDNQILHQQITWEEIDDVVSLLADAKDSEPRGVTLNLDSPMTKYEYEERIAKFIPTLRDMAYEHLVVEFDYKHPWGISFIQTVNADEEGGYYCLEVGYFEQPPIKAKKNKIYSKLYRLEPMKDVGLREVLDTFRQVVLVQGDFAISRWTDITKKAIRSDYILQDKSDLPWLK